MNLAASDVRRVRVEQRSESSKDAALGLATQSKKNEIVTRENCVHDLRNDRVVVTDDARENRTVLSKLRNQVVAQLVFHTARAQFFFRKGASAQLAEGEGKTHRGTTPKALSYQPETAAEYFDYTPAWKQAFGGGRQLGTRTLLIVIPTLTSEGPRRRTFRCVWTCRDVERSRSYVRSVVFPPAVLPELADVGSLSRPLLACEFGMTTH